MHPPQVWLENAVKSFTIFTEICYTVYPSQTLLFFFLSYFLFDTFILFKVKNSKRNEAKAMCECSEKDITRILQGVKVKNFNRKKAKCCEKIFFVFLWKTCENHVKRISFGFISFWRETLFDVKPVYPIMNVKIQREETIFCSCKGFYLFAHDTFHILAEKNSLSLFYLLFILYLQAPPPTPPEIKINRRSCHTSAGHLHTFSYYWGKWWFSSPPEDQH